MLHEGGFTRIERLNLNFNDLQSIAGNAFAGARSLSRLLVLNVSGNQLESFGPDHFRGLESLKAIDGSHNQLQAIEPHAFAGLKNLTSLDLSGNTALVYVGAWAWGGLANRSSSGGGIGQQASLRMTRTSDPSGNMGSSCQINATTAKVVCYCGVDKYAQLKKNHDERRGRGGGEARRGQHNDLVAMPGGAEGRCVCPAGQYHQLFGSYISCYQCPRGQYSDAPDASACILCPAGRDWTDGVGTKSLAGCMPDPKLSAVKARISELQVTFISAGVLAMTTVALVAYCLVHRNRERDAYEVSASTLTLIHHPPLILDHASFEAELRAKNRQLQQTASELDYVNNWRSYTQPLPPFFLCSHRLPLRLLSTPTL